MKFTTTTAMALTTLLATTTTANFHLYRAGNHDGGIGGAAWGWQAYDGEPSCSDILGWYWRSSDDVSGGKYGVRCSPDDACAASSDARDIEELEMNFNSDELHWTIYKDREYAMVDLEGNRVGTCEPDDGEGHEFSCGLDPVGRGEGVLKFVCESEFTAEEINDNRPS